MDAGWNRVGKGSPIHITPTVPEFHFGFYLGEVYLVPSFKVIEGRPSTVVSELDALVVP